MRSLKTGSVNILLDTHIVTHTHTYIHCIGINHCRYYKMYLIEVGWTKGTNLFRDISEALRQMLTCKIVLWYECCIAHWGSYLHPFCYCMQLRFRAHAKARFQCPKHFIYMMPRLQKLGDIWRVKFSTFHLNGLVSHSYCLSGHL